jgi:ornithine decarboxylase
MFHHEIRPGLKILRSINTILATSTAHLLFSRSKLLRQVELWRTYLPRVQPHYAVKANNDPMLLRWIAGAGCAFDCASIREMHDVARTGVPADRIIYAQPCKTAADVQQANWLGVPNTVVDSPEEVEKLKKGEWSGGVLIRLLVPDAGSAQPFSRKFGAPIEWVPDILRELRAASIQHVGWSFHVGSVCSVPQQFARAIELCAEGDKMAGRPAAIVDVGGGFVPDEAAFAAAARAINESHHLFPRSTRWIGEPGRFFCAPAVDATVKVIGKKRRVDGSGFRYTLDESIYGIFSNIPFDGFRPTFEVPGSAGRPRARATIFGRTCDSADCIVEDAEMPELHVGDRLTVREMGAYTIVSASEFNGFPRPQCIYGD